MSFVETETVVSSSGLSDVDGAGKGGEFRQRRKARRTESLQLLSTETENDKTSRKKICRRHSYAFRCQEHEVDQDGDDGKHYESALLVKVFATAIASNADDSWIYY